MHDRIPHADLVDFLDAGDQVTDLPRLQRRHSHRPRGQHPDLGSMVTLTGRCEQQRVTLGQSSIHHPQVADHPPVGVVVRVEDQSPQRPVGVRARLGDLRDNSLQQLLDAFSGLGGEPEHVGCFDAQDGGQLVGGPIGIGGR